MDEIKLFALHASENFGVKMAQHLGISLGKHEERDFEDGEHKARPLESVRNRDVFVVQSLYKDEKYSVNDKLCRLLFFIGALKDAAAASVTVVAPYLCYMRKDRKTKSRDPVTTRYIASIIEAVGTDRIITIDVHNLQAFQNAFRCRTEHLEAKYLFTHYFSKNHGRESFSILSPDAGGVKRALSFRKVLQKSVDYEIPFTFLEKERSEGVVSGETIVGNMEGRSVIILDDLISSGTTMIRAARACKEKGAHKVYAVATHAAFVSKPENLIKEETLDKIVITNTIDTGSIEHDKLVELDVAPLIAEASQYIHSGRSLGELQEF